VPAVVNLLTVAVKNCARHGGENGLVAVVQSCSSDSFRCHVHYGIYGKHKKNSFIYAIGYIMEYTFEINNN